MARLVGSRIPLLISLIVSSLVTRYVRVHPIIDYLAMVCSVIGVFWLMNALPWQLRGNSESKK